MPVYEYKCQDCGKVSSVLMKSSKAKAQKCPACGSGKMEKQFSTFAGYVKESGSDNCGGCCNSGHCPHAH